MERVSACMCEWWKEADDGATEKAYIDKRREVTRGDWAGLLVIERDLDGFVLFVVRVEQ